MVENSYCHLLCNSGNFAEYCCVVAYFRFSVSPTWHFSTIKNPRGTETASSWPTPGLRYDQKPSSVHALY